MQIEQAKKLMDEALEQLAHDLEQGKSDTLTRFLAALAQFHRYSFGNVMLIMSQRPTATRVAGFNTWRKFGRFVQKGEKGILIIAPMLVKKKEDEAEDEKGKLLLFKAVHVFDVSQTEGEPLPEPATVAGDPGAHTERLKAFIAERGIELEYAEDLGSADGVSIGGKIRLRPDLAPAEEFSVLAHELAHEFLHHGEDRAATTRTIRETEAEAVAYTVCRAIGLETGSAASDYIQTYKGDKQLLAASLHRIQEVATRIISAVLPGE